jgi:hypothetical protein
MQQYKIEKKINAPASKVWAILDDFGNIYRFSPGVATSSLLDGPQEGVGAQRKCEFYDDAGYFIEAIGTREEGKSIRVDVVEMHLKQPAPIEKFYVDFEVSPETSSTSFVTATGHYETIGISGKILNALVIRKTLRKALASVIDGLALHIETGAEIGPNLEPLNVSSE